MVLPAQETTELKLRLSKAASAKLAERAAQAGRDIASVATDLIEQAVGASPEVPVDGDSAQRAAAWEAWVTEMRQWGKTNLSSGHVIDDSRESIYEGRGE